MTLDDTREAISTVDSLRGVLLDLRADCGFGRRRALIGNAVAIRLLYFITSMVLAGYITGNLFRVDPTDVLFASDAGIRAKCTAHRALN